MWADDEVVKTMIRREPLIVSFHFVGAVGPEGSALVFLIYGLAALAFVLIYKRKPWRACGG